MKRRIGWAVLLCACVCRAWGLGPHELLVIANGRSADSIEVAKEFMALRHVPRANLVRLTLPQRQGRTPVGITPQEFTRTIWEPARRAMRERRIDDHILAWIYSCDMPVRITTERPISIQGLTFLRNRLPDPTVVHEGRYLSPLFTGPSNPNGTQHRPQSIDTYARWLGPEMPLPSMMLGVTGRNGNTTSEILACLRRGVAADGTAPHGTVYFVIGADVRSRCRQWQFALAKAELRLAGLHSVITGERPTGLGDVLGVMMGTANVRPLAGTRFLPGAMAEHLTSAAAVFDADPQTKLTFWIKSGATASAGTVTEPLSNWAKFPGARFFAHYAAGCCMLESFAQSIRCPLQILLVGEPLARPWAPEARLVLNGLETDTLSGEATLRARVNGAAGDHYAAYRFLVDGVTLGSGPVCTLKAADLGPGGHTVRAVAYRTGLVRAQVFAEQRFTVAR